MTLILSGTNGVSDVDGTAATPAVRGSDTNTGIFFPAADTIAFAEGGVEVARFDASGNLALGTTTADARLTVYGGEVRWGASSSVGALSYTGSAPVVASIGANPLLFFTNGSQQATITSGGLLQVGTTALGSGRINTVTSPSFWGMVIQDVAANSAMIQFLNSAGAQAGSITVSGTTTTYGSGSDYRLKDEIVPMTGALEKVQALKPVAWKWKSNGSDGQGFIAHELSAVCPDAVVGEKDAVNEDGSIKPQMVDTSFLVATLTAAIQELHAQHIELKAIVDQQATEIANLKGQA